MNIDTVSDIKKAKIDEKHSPMLQTLSKNQKTIHIKNPLHKYQYDSIDFSKNLEFTSSLADSDLQTL